MESTFGEVIERLRRSTVAVRAQRSGGGSGAIWAAEGSIITNAHVVEGSSGAAAEIAEVELWDGRRLPAKIVQRDRRRDLAVLRVEAIDLPAVTAGDSSALRPGALVIAVGNPLGFIGAASTGVVHASHDRSWVVSQLRLAPGNSGGPLANARGEVVGINTMIAGGLAFAIPSRTVARFLNQKAEPEFGLGVVVRPVWLDRSAREFGLLVLEVTPGSAADRASLLQGDVLIGANGRPFHAVEDLDVAIQASRAGILDLQFRRAANPNVAFAERLGQFFSGGMQAGKELRRGHHQPAIHRRQSALEIVDSFIGRMLASIASMARLLDAETVVVGMQPAVAITLVELGLPMRGIRTALDVEKGMTALRAAIQEAGQDGDPGRIR